MYRWESRNMGKGDTSVQQMWRYDRGINILAILLVSTLCCQSIIGLGASAYAYRSQQQIVPNSCKKISEEILTSGAKLMTYEYTVQRKQKRDKTRMNVIKTDLQHPYIKLNVMTGQNGKTAVGNAVTKMAQETGAVAAVNGDYWMMGADKVPLGGSISEGTIITSPAELTGMYAFVITKNGQPMIDQYRFAGQVKLADGNTYPLLGINKMKYGKEPMKKHSHIDAMYVYTNAWQGDKRPRDTSTTPTEVLVQNGVIEQISDEGALQMEVPADGFILRGHGKAAEFMKQFLTIGTAVELNYHLLSQSTGKEIDPSSIHMMISGHTLLIDDGQAVRFTRKIDGISGYQANARTAVGYSQDGQYMYMVTAEKNQVSSGFTLKEFQQALMKVGIWKAVNLDGGGSTTMVNRPLGDFDVQLTHETKAGGRNIRPVVNGLGVYTQAPAGKVKGIMLGGEKQLFIGQQATYRVKMYDEYYNPIHSNDHHIEWRSLTGKMKWNGDYFVANKPGEEKIVAVFNRAKKELPVRIIGADDVLSIRIAAGSAPLIAGTSMELPVKVVLKNGGEVALPPAAVRWELHHISGEVINGRLHIQAVPAKTDIAYVIASYDGFRTMLPLTVKSRVTDLFPAATMQLTVNRKTAKVNRNSKQLDVAPIGQQGTTYVPMRVIVDAFGGKVTWNDDSKRVTVMRGNRFLDLTINKKQFTRNGERCVANVASIVYQGRTLVPLRCVSEQLGLTVTWEQRTKSIVIQQ